MGLLDSVRPILGYVVGIAVVMILAGMSFMAVVSASLTSSASTMASVLILVALLVGVGAASRAARES
jgi:hypothetical protein